jgi:hypothetical protein
VKGCGVVLEVDEAVFPNNVVKFVALAEATIDEDVRIFKRPLRNTDPRQSIGVFAQGWDPDPESLEIAGIGAENPAPQMPTIQRYTLGLQAFVKDAEEERGLAVHSVLAQRTRMVLYTNGPLQVIFGQLVTTPAVGWTESMTRWGIRTARYFSGDIAGEMLYLSTLEFWIETQTRRTI